MAFFRDPAKQALFDALLASAASKTSTPKYHDATQAVKMQREEKLERDTGEPPEPFTPAEWQGYLDAQVLVLRYIDEAIAVIRRL